MGARVFSFFRGTWGAVIAGLVIVAVLWGISLTVPGGRTFTPATSADPAANQTAQTAVDYVDIAFQGIIYLVKRYAWILALAAIIIGLLRLRSSMAADEAAEQERIAARTQRLEAENDAREKVGLSQAAARKSNREGYDTVLNETMDVLRTAEGFKGAVKVRARIKPDGTVPLRISYDKGPSGPPPAHP